MRFLSPSSWQLITGFGSVGVMIPVALAIGGWFAIARNWRAALVWLGLLSMALGIVAATKIAFIGWGIGIQSVDSTGISGHSMLSTAVFPIIFDTVLLFANRPIRLAGVAAGLACGALIGVSRFTLQAHSIAEIVSGCMLGALVVLIYMAVTRHMGAARRPSPLIVGVSVGMLIAALHGLHVPTQRWITQVALSLSGHERPVVRAHWKKHRLRFSAAQ